MDEYIYGRLTVHWGRGIVSLAHEVGGRVTHMDLADSDEIIVVKDNKKITIKDVLVNVHDELTAPDRKLLRGMSVYEGSRVKVKLDPNVSNLLTYKQEMIRMLFKIAETGLHTYEEVEEEIVHLENDFYDQK